MVTTDCCDRISTLLHVHFLCLMCFFLLHNLLNERRWPDFKEAAGAAQKIQIYLFRGVFYIAFIICVSFEFFLFVLVFIICFIVIFLLVLCKGLCLVDILMGLGLGRWHFAGSGFGSLTCYCEWVWVVGILLEVHLGCWCFGESGFGSLAFW